MQTDELSDFYEDSHQARKPNWSQLCANPHAEEQGCEGSPQRFPHTRAASSSLLKASRG